MDYSSKFTEDKSERDNGTFQVSIAEWQYLDLNSGCKILDAKLQSCIFLIIQIAKKYKI